MERVVALDDNAKLMELIEERLAKGVKTYGHGIQAHKGEYDWLQMALEELLDATLYLAAEIVRRRG